MYTKLKERLSIQYYNLSDMTFMQSTELILLGVCCSNFSTVFVTCTFKLLYYVVYFKQGQSGSNNYNNFYSVVFYRTRLKNGVCHYPQITYAGCVKLYFDQKRFDDIFVAQLVRY